MSEFKAGDTVRVITVSHECDSMSTVKERYQNGNSYEHNGIQIGEEFILTDANKVYGFYQSAGNRRNSIPLACLRQVSPTFKVGDKFIATEGCAFLPTPDPVKYPSHHLAKGDVLEIVEVIDGSPLYKCGGGSYAFGRAPIPMGKVKPYSDGKQPMSVKVGDQFIVVADDSTFPTCDRERYEQISPTNRLRKGDIITVAAVASDGRALYEYGTQCTNRFRTPIPMHEVKPYQPTKEEQQPMGIKVGDQFIVTVDVSDSPSPERKRYMLNRPHDRLRKGDIVTVTHVGLDGNAYYEYGTWFRNLTSVPMKEVMPKPVPKAGDWVRSLNEEWGYQGPSLIGHYLGPFSSYMKKGKIFKVKRVTNQGMLVYATGKIPSHCVAVVPDYQPRRYPIGIFAALLPITGLFAMNSFFNSVASDPLVQKSVVGVIVASSTFIVGSLGMVSVKNVARSIGQLGDRRRRLREEAENRQRDAILAAIKNNK